MFARRGLLWSAVLLIACRPEEEPPQDGVHPIDGLDTDLPTDDLQPFFDAVGDAKFVGLGETVHTSGGFYAAKVRLFQALVEEEGFRAIGFETPWEDALVATEYVRTCQGDPKDAVGSLFGVWADVAVLEMMQWMCQWNTEHPDDTVVFWGWDIQQPWDDGRLLGEYLAAVAPDDADELSAGISTCVGVGYADQDAWFSSPQSAVLNTGVNEQDHAACLDGITAIRAYFDANQSTLVAASSADALAWARVSLEGLKGWEDMVAVFDRCPASYTARDVANAKVLPEIHRLLVGDRRSVIWAHNTHLASDNGGMHGTYGDPEGTQYCDGWDSMGTFLSGELGDDWAPFALAAHETAYRWFQPISHLTTPWDPYAVEVMLHDVGWDYAFVDLAAPESPFDDGEYEMAGYWAPLRDDFRGIVFLEDSPPMSWARRVDLPGTCASGEVEFRGDVQTQDLDDIVWSEGVTVCRVGGACTTSVADGHFELCAPADSPVAVSFAKDGYAGQVALLGTGDKGNEIDFRLVTEGIIDNYVYNSPSVAFPPPPGTGLVSGAVYDEYWRPLQDATLAMEPPSGSVVYLSSGGAPLATLDHTTGSGGFVFSGVTPGDADVIVTHETHTDCRFADFPWQSPAEGAAARVPVVDQFETDVYIQCTP